MKKYPYQEAGSDIFGKVNRPLIAIKIYSTTKNIWIPVYDVLVDTGADMSIIPRYLGNLIVEDITTGKEIKIKGFVPYSELIAYIHKIKIKLVDKEIELSVAIADSDKTIPILGRVEGIDLFDVEFQKGKFIIFND